MMVLLVALLIAAQGPGAAAAGFRKAGSAALDSELRDASEGALRQFSAASSRSPPNAAMRSAEAWRIVQGRGGVKLGTRVLELAKEFKQRTFAEGMDAFQGAKRVRRSGGRCAEGSHGRGFLD